MRLILRAVEAFPGSPTSGFETGIIFRALQSIETDMTPPETMRDIDS